MEVTTVGIDLAKNVFRLHGCDARGRAVLRKQLGRRQLLAFVARLPRCVVAMEACASAHYWAREIQKLGHRVRLINPRFVRPYVKANKNDASDAEAICEAAGRPAMRFVAVKTAAQQDVQAVHRVRQQLVKNHTALMNQVRALLAEQGIVIPQGSAHVHRSLPRILADDDNRLSGMMRELLNEIGERLRYIEERLRQYELHPAAVSRGRTLPTLGRSRRCRSRDRDCTGGRGRQRGRVQERARTGGLLGTGPAPPRQRRPHHDARHQQARRSLSAHAAGSWRTSGAARQSAPTYDAQCLDRTPQI
jgi:transposase